MAFTGNAACNVFKTGLLDGTYDFGTGTTDVYKIALYTNAATLDSDTTAYTATGEVTDSGYTAGGATLTISQVPTIGAQTGSGASAYISFSNASWSGAITARGALVYKYNGTTNPAVFVLDFGSDKTSTTTFQVQFPTASSTSAILRLA
jgi:hypothetical protein